METSFESSEMPRLQLSCSPENPEALVEPTRWQRLRVLAHSQSLLTAGAASTALVAYGATETLRTASSPLERNTAQLLPYMHTHLLRTPAHLASAKAKLLLQASQVNELLTDSIDADLQVEAVLCKAAARAAHLAGLPQAASGRSKALAALPPQPQTHLPFEGRKVPITLPCSPLLTLLLHQTRQLSVHPVITSVSSL